MKKLSNILKSCIVIFFIIVSVFYGKKLFSHFLSNKNAVSVSSNLEADIAMMNPEPYVFDEEKFILDSNEKTLKLLVIGNSISVHGIAPDIWDHESGMAASSKEKDWCHILVNKIFLEKKLNVDFAVLNLADFERKFEIFDFNLLEKVKSFSPDIVIFQLGENVRKADITEKTDSFKSQYKKLILNFPEAKKIICLPFWPDINKNSAITDVAIETNSILVDLSHLSFDQKNFAKSEKEFSLPGVGEHPGDFGMENIAKLIWGVINAN